MSSKHDAIEAQSKAIREDRRREDDEARGTRFAQEILDTDVYEENARTDYLNYLPGNDDEVILNYSVLYDHVRNFYFD
ncbi:unnamed protein product [Rotaria magnacalcarata]|uniref:Uncharacterized protein n=1 Tax=Rotaria magnacalcarata TaxID=392030 RepID=A0A8S3FYA3_9BILA|nr:unnamed protein product [Rotaria magnacalcarata]CAF5215075.1 unnamed protein product [Rotaria magnacalcarata]